MKRSIRALALVCAAVLSLLCFAACGGDPATDPEEAVTLDATPFLDGYHLDFDAYLKTQGLSYAGIWSLPTVLPAYRSNAVCDTLTGAATVHWDLVSDTEFANVREYYECELQYYFDYYTTMYANYGLAFEYATAEAFAPDLFGYDKATYPTFRDFADAQTKDRFGKMLVMQAFCLAAGILPTEEEVDDYYNTYITRIALSSGASVAQIEAQYADECGEHFLPFTMRQNQLIELTEAYAEEHWTFDVPEVTEADKTAIDPAEYRETATATDLVKMHIHSEDGSVDGDVYIRLYPEYAPITVANFRQLVADGFYNGLTFHRSQRGFCLQGGDPNGNGSGGSSRTIKGEFVENGVGNPLSHLSGVVSMARANAYDSASSQFFFTMSDNYQSSLDGKYAAFGYVVSGWDVVTAAHALPVDTANNNKPLTTITMTNVTFAEKIPE